MPEFFNPTDYQSLAAGQSATVMGPTNVTTKDAGSQYLKHIVIVPATLSPGAVAIKDGADTAITIFTGGASSVTSLAPITVPVMARNKTGSWQVSTGSNVSIIAVGRFT